MQTQLWSSLSLSLIDPVLMRYENLLSFSRLDKVELIDKQDFPYHRHKHVSLEFD